MKRSPRPDAATLRTCVRRIDFVLRKTYGDPKLAPARSLLGQLIETILSQNTTDTNSSRAFRELRRRFPRWDDVAAARPSAVAQAIWSAGLANTKAPRIQAILRRIQTERGRLSLAHLRKMSNSAAMDWLLSLPGVGPKTAACVLLFGMGRDVFPVDTHIHRLCRRLGMVSHFTSAEKTQEQMAGAIPKGRALAFHINLIRHGRLICRAQRPRCAVCILAAMCPSARDDGSRD
ncbi:MAG: endonuclease III [Verrucomicrobia bacterium]|nr:endonuclease III [Verrucomicrobiota bacterium]